MNFIFEPQFLAWAMVVSMAFFFVSLVAMPYIICALPADYFTRSASFNFSLKNILLLVIRNAIGLALLVAGVAMLVLPGQGLLTILVALMVMRYPGKQWLEYKIITQKQVLKLANWIRQKRGKPPFQI